MWTSPHFLRRCRCCQKDPRRFQGRSFLPQFKGETPDDWRKSFYYHYYEFPGAHSVRRHYGVRTETHKLIRFYGIDEWELYDSRLILPSVLADMAIPSMPKLRPN